MKEWKRDMALLHACCCIEAGVYLCVRFGTLLRCGQSLSLRAFCHTAA